MGCASSRDAGDTPAAARDAATATATATATNFNTDNIANTTANSNSSSPRHGATLRSFVVTAAASAEFTVAASTPMPTSPAATATEPDNPLRPPPPPETAPAHHLAQRPPLAPAGNRARAGSAHSSPLAAAGATATGRVRAVSFARGDPRAAGERRRSRAPSGPPLPAPRRHAFTATTSPFRPDEGDEYPTATVASASIVSILDVSDALPTAATSAEPSPVPLASLPSEVPKQRRGSLIPISPRAPIRDTVLSVSPVGALSPSVSPRAGGGGCAVALESVDC